MDSLKIIIAPLNKLNLGDYEQRIYLLQESFEWKLIFGSIHTKCFRKEIDAQV